MNKESLTVKASAEIYIYMPVEVVEAVSNALSPEIEAPSSHRSRTYVRVDGEELIISTEASDTTAMRAAVNSYLRWVQGILDMLSRIE